MHSKLNYKKEFIYNYDLVIVLMIIHLHTDR